MNIPIYNIKKYIIQCLESISKQYLKEIDIIYIKDGAYRNNKKMKRNNIKIISQKNRGKSIARNSGVKY